MRVGGGDDGGGHGDARWGIEMRKRGCMRECDVYSTRFVDQRTSDCATSSRDL